MLAQELPVWFCAFVWFKTEVSLAPGWQAKMVQGSMMMAAPHTHVTIAST